ncbi:MAG: ATP-binding cassette domain-containing protein, partial [Xanthobacteraceae bacterium]
MRLLGHNLACVRGGRAVFSGLGLDISAGRALLIRGPNGAGKSSLLRLVAGLVGIAGGTLTLEGGDADATVAEQTHYLGHQDALKPSLTVAEN